MLIAVTDFARSKHALSAHYQVGDFRFNNTFWYHDCDFHDLEARYGVDFMRRVYLHIVGFEVNKLSSINASQIDFGPFNDLVDGAFMKLWRRIVDGVWAQWRYENSLPDWQPPEFVGEVIPSEGLAKSTVAEGPVRYLSFCGGGKDSAVTTHLLDHAGVTSDAFVYAHSVYGRADKQFEIISGMLSQYPERQQRRLTVLDDFLEAPLALIQADFGVASITAAETPSSIFAALPVVLQHGYRYLVLGHEKSADKGNLTWADTGSEVNHQWGKSTEAENLLAAYLRDNLVDNLDFFSILKPIHDVNIFGLLQRQPPSAIRATHSCNIDKPWCKRCAKCVYVWLNYLAYLDHDLVLDIFGENLFDIAENYGLIRELIGLTEATPFECIGEAGESMLALALAIARGARGEFVGELAEHVPADLDQIISDYTLVDTHYPNYPAELAPLMTYLVAVSADTKRWITHELAGVAVTGNEPS